jgi:hypothetical protein
MVDRIKEVVNNKCCLEPIKLNSGAKRAKALNLFGH